MYNVTESMLIKENTYFSFNDMNMVLRENEI